MISRITGLISFHTSKDLPGILMLFVQQSVFQSKNKTTVVLYAYLYIPYNVDIHRISRTSQQAKDSTETTACSSGRENKWLLNKFFYSNDKNLARVTSLQLQCWKSLLSTSLTIQPIIQPDILATTCRNIVFLKNTIDNIQIFNPVVDQPTRKIPLKYI